MKHNRLFTFLLIGFVAYALYQVSFMNWQWDVVLITLLCVYVYTDLLSGVLHIILDNERSLNVSVIRPLAKGFQEHHRDPNSIYEMSLYAHLYTMHLPLVLAFPFVFLLNFSMGYFVYLGFVISLHLMQMAHRWAHLPKSQVTGVLKVLQTSGMLVSRKIHLGHHNGIYDENFCIMNGWFNRPLNWAVRTFGKTGHWWNAVFLFLVSLAFLIPAFVFKW